MESIVLNELGHDGMRRIKIVSDAEIVSEKYGSMIPSDALDKASWSVGVDSILWLHTLEISFPVYGPHEVQYPSTKKFRRFMFVHYSYASRVSECVELARNAFMSSTGFPAHVCLHRDPAKRGG